MLTPEQERQLVSGGDCPLHSHSQDRRATHDLLSGLHQIAVRRQVSANYAFTDNDDFVEANSSTGNLTITLPLPHPGRECEVLKSVTANQVIILPSGTATVLWTTGAVLRGQGSAIRLKAIGNNWVAI